MRGLLYSPPGAQSRPAIVLMHDAYGLGEQMVDIAQDLASLGYAVFAADIWGDREQLLPGEDIGAFIGHKIF